MTPRGAIPGLLNSALYRMATDSPDAQRDLRFQPNERFTAANGLDRMLLSEQPATKQPGWLEARGT